MINSLRIICHPQAHSKQLAPTFSVSERFIGGAYARYIRITLLSGSKASVGIANIGSNPCTRSSGSTRFDDVHRISWSRLICTCWAYSSVGSCTRCVSRNPGMRVCSQCTQPVKFTLISYSYAFRSTFVIRLPLGTASPFLPPMMVHIVRYALLSINILSLRGTLYKHS